MNNVSVLAPSLFILAVLPMPKVSGDDCGKCRVILAAGIRNDLGYSNEKDFRADLRWVAALSHQERQQYLRENSDSLSTGVKRILELCLSGNSNAELFAAFRESLLVQEQAAWHSHIYERICLKLVRKEVVAVWNDCQKRCGLKESRIRGQVLSTGSESFIVVVRYTPMADNDPKAVTVKGFTSEGADPKGIGYLKEGASIEQFASLAQVFQRKGTAAVALTVDLEGQPPLVVKIPAMQQPPVPPSEPPTEFCDIQVNIYGKQDAEGDRWGYNTHDSEQQPVFWEFGKRVVEAKVIHNPYESEFVEGGRMITLQGNRIILNLKLTEDARKKWSEGGDSKKQNGPTFTVLVLVTYEE
jgi:hypothetical protein